MNKEILLFVLKAFTIISLVITLVSVFFFTRGGRITQKGILVTYICFLFFAISIWGLGAFYKPSLAVSAGLCLGSFLSIFSVFWAIKYYSLPSIERKTKEMPHDKTSKK
jgi:hypothetical protein